MDVSCSGGEKIRNIEGVKIKKKEKWKWENIGKRNIKKVNKRNRGRMMEVENNGEYGEKWKKVYV